MSTSPPLRTGNALENVRRRNLAIILTLVHDEGPLSRSRLTRESGLNRSTVGALVGELETLGLVHEGPPAAATGAGRPSPVVRASRAVAAVAVNPEIDAITVALVGLDGGEIARLRRGVGHVPSVAEALELTASMVSELRTENRDSRILGVGLAIPGIVRELDGLIRLAPHLGWFDEPFADRLAELTGLAVSASNDATLGVRAEHLAGSARGLSDVVYLNGGASGIGGGIIAGGRVVGGCAGYAGELGHTLVDPAGVRCHCGSIGCLETVVSQRALLAAAGVPHDGSDREVAGELLRTALAAPSAELDAEVDHQLRALAIALRNVISTLAPELIVLGGFLGVLHEYAGDRLEALVAEQTMPILLEGVHLRTAELGSTILLRGAADLVFESLLADPATVSVPVFVPVRAPVR